MIHCRKEEHRATERTETHRGCSARCVRRGRPPAGRAEGTRDHECKRLQFVVSLAFVISRALLPREARPCGLVRAGEKSDLNLARRFRVFVVIRGLNLHVSVRLCDLCASVFLFRVRGLNV
jgi:hypothetical protein